MRHTPRFAAVILGLMIGFLPMTASATKPIKALYLTNYSSFWHDYEEQVGLLRTGLSRYANLELTLVGKRESDLLETLKRERFAEGYDVVIYNMCFADPADRDSSRIDNIIAQTRDLGVPAVLLHCAMHSFGGSEAWWPRCCWGRWRGEARAGVSPWVFGFIRGNGSRP